MKVATSEQMREIDRKSISECGIPASVLMFNAGKAVADLILRDYPSSSNISIFCGTGNNGGDGFVAAYCLKNLRLRPSIFLLGQKDKISTASKIYYNLCVYSGLNPVEIHDPESIDLSGSDLIVDALTGTGFSGKPKENLAMVISTINESGKFVISVDMPSGLDSDGEYNGPDAIHASTTVTMGLPKLSHVTYPNKKFCGALHVADIGFPAEFTSDSSIKTDLSAPELFNAQMTPYTDCDSHKGDNGSLLLIGGFDGMEGAIMLSALAAFETGIGYGVLLTTPSSRNIIAGRIPELITRSIDQSSYNRKILDDILNEKKFDAVLVGPGMGRDEFSYKIFNDIISAIASTSASKVLIDGDGLFHLAEYLKKSKLPSKIQFIITPHFKEASRLLDMDMDGIKKSRHASAIKLSQMTGCTAVLKGPATITADGNSTVINTSGNQLLATAGSGDVLSGIIGALMLKNSSPLLASSLGVYVHGVTADLIRGRSNITRIKSSDIIPYIRPAFDYILSKKLKNNNAGTL